MEINSTAAPVSQLVNGQQLQQQQPAAANDREVQEPQPSTVVNLSAEAVQRNRAETQQAGNNAPVEPQAASSARAETQANVNTEQPAPRPQETAEPPGIEFVESTNKNGRVDAFA